MKRGNRKTYRLLWAIICLLATAVWIAWPVSETRSLGLEGANQANLVSATEELTGGRVLEFTLEAPAESAEQIGFFFTTNGHTFEDGTLRLMAYGDDVLIGGLDYALEDLTEDQFLFVPLHMDELSEAPSALTVRIACNAGGEGPSVWLNETTVTPGTASLDGEALSKSLVYNLSYTVSTHRVWTPVFGGLILLLFGLGILAVQETSGEKRPQERSALFVRPSVRQLFALAACVCLTALLFFYLYDTKIRIAQNTTEKATVLEADGGTLPVTEETARLSQEAEPGQKFLTGFGVRFYLEDSAVLTDGQVHASVTDLTLGEVLCETDVEASQILSGEYVGLLFRDSQTDAADHRYRIDLVFSEELMDSGLAVMTSEEGLCVSAYLYYNIFLKRFFFFMFLAVEAFLCVFWYLAFVKRARLENVFLVTVLFFGLIYNVMLTPQMVPDEAKHIDMAYRYSNTLLGYESIGDTKCLMRADDAAIGFTSSPSIANYRKIYYGLFSGVQDASMVEADVSSNIEGSFLLYVPAVLGMTLSRLLGLGTVPMLLLARYLNLLVFALLARAGMKRLPFGKMTLFVLALLPINMQQCTSFSHDAMVHGILFLYGCLCLQAIYSEERMNMRRMAALEILALCLLYCKGGSYLPLAFLPVLIPAARFGGRREKGAALLSLLGIPVLAFLMKHIQTVASIAGTTAATSVVGSSDGSAYTVGYTLGYFLQDPLELIYMLANTVFDKTGFYLESLVGYQLGWVEIETSMLVVLLFWFLIFLSNCECAGETIRIKKRERLTMVLLCLGCTGLILLGMLLSWTPMGHVSIEGVQGRYFLPFMLILLTACRNGRIRLSRPVDRGIAAAAVCGQLLTLTYLIRQVLTV